MAENALNGPAHCLALSKHTSEAFIGILQDDASATVRSCCLIAPMYMCDCQGLWSFAHVDLKGQLEVALLRVTCISLCSKQLQKDGTLCSLGEVC